FCSCPPQPPPTPLPYTPLFRSEAEQHRHVFAHRRRPEMLVHRMRAGKQIAKILLADGDHDRQADRRPQRIAPADPVPKAEDTVLDRKSTRLNSSHVKISYAVFC